MINRTKKRKTNWNFQNNWTNFLLLKKQMKSLNWNCSNQTKIQMWIDIQMRRHWAMTMRISTKTRNALNIWMKNQSSLLKIVEKMKNLIEILIFNWIFVVNDWFRSTRQIERAIKFSTTTTTRIMMSSWFDRLNTKLFENWYVKRQKMMSFCLRISWVVFE